MPCAVSTSGTRLQSLQAMQWLRFETGGETPGRVLANAASCVLTIDSYCAWVVRAQPVSMWIATSKPRLS